MMREKKKKQINLYCKIKWMRRFVERRARDFCEQNVCLHIMLDKIRSLENVAVCFFRLFFLFLLMLLLLYHLLSLFLWLFSIREYKY